MLEAHLIINYLPVQPNWKMDHCPDCSTDYRFDRVVVGLLSNASLDPKQVPFLVMRISTSTIVTVINPALHIQICNMNILCTQQSRIWYLHMYAS